MLSTNQVFHSKVSHVDAEPGLVGTVLMHSQMFPSALVTIDRKIVLHNPAAALLAANRPDLVTLDGAIEFPGRHAVNAAIAEALATAQAGRKADSGSRRRAVSIGGADGRTIGWVVVERLYVEPDPIAGDTSGDVALFLISLRFPDLIRPHDPDYLMTALGVTRSEAQLLTALAQSESLVEYALRTGRKTTTVRWHLRNLLAKTGCNSQRELITLVNMLCV